MDLQPLRDDYVARLAKHDIAPNLSLKLSGAEFLWEMCEARRPARILDLGAGLSTFVFRTWAFTQETTPEVVTGEGNAGWLYLIKLLTRDAKLTGSHLHAVHLEKALCWQHDFDLIFVDHGPTFRNRVRDVPAYMHKLAKGGCVVFDDWNQHAYPNDLTAALKAAGWPRPNPAAGTRMAMICGR